MKAKVIANKANILNRIKETVLSTNPKTGAQVNDGNWRWKDTYTVAKKGDVVEVDDVSARNLIRKGVLETITA